MAQILAGLMMSTYPPDSTMKRRQKILDLRDWIWWQRSSLTRVLPGRMAYKPTTPDTSGILSFGYMISVVFWNIFLSVIRFYSSSSSSSRKNQDYWPGSDSFKWEFKLDIFCITPASESNWTIMKKWQQKKWLWIWLIGYRDAAGWAADDGFIWRHCGCCTHFTVDVPTLYPLYSWWAPRVLDKPLATMPPPPLLLFSSSWEADGELSKQ